MSIESGLNPIDENVAKKFPIGKFLFFGIMAMALSSFPPLAIFAPVPLALAFLLMGRKWGVLLGALGFVLLVAVTMMFKIPSTGSVLFFIGFLNALLISETIFRKINPAKSLTWFGLILFGLMLLFAALYVFGIPAQVKNQLVSIVVNLIEKFKNETMTALSSSSSEDAKVVKEMFGHPVELARQIIQWIPRMTFLSMIVGFWISFFVILRNAFLWRGKVDYPFVLDDLLGFKAPDFLVYAVIIGMGLLLGDQYLGSRALVWGETLVYALGAIYFFQGFGVFLAFLAWMGVWGIFRTIMIAMVLLLAWRVLPVVGLFDLWIDFRSRFKKKTEDKENDNDKGDWL